MTEYDALSGAKPRQDYERQLMRVETRRRALEEGWVRALLMCR